jgi:hypothetical protein|tara:strand:- start:2168 stop:2548 length:381 start_codon:yes stop_codon:yes gene_type:complete
MNENVKPRFEVHKLEGTGRRRVATPKIEKDEKGKPVKNEKGHSVLLGGFDYEDLEVDAGWMVYFPNGSSIHVWTEEEMQRQGFLDEPTLVNLETGDELGTASHSSLKSLSEQKERVTKSNKHAQTL